MQKSNWVKKFFTIEVTLVLFILIGFFYIFNKENSESNFSTTIVENSTTSETKQTSEYPKHVYNVVTPDIGIQPPCQYRKGRYVVTNKYGTFKVKAMNRYPKSYKVPGVASYYSDEYVGEEMSCGGKFDKEMFVAAHRELPMGTVVCVTNEENNKPHPFVITDRGPFVDGNRLIDVSEAGARKLGFVKKGLTNISVTLIRNLEERTNCV